MTARRLLVALVYSIGAAALLSSPASAQLKWEDVECSGAEIAFEPGYRCRKSSEEGTGHARIRQRRSVVVGEAGGLYLSATLFTLSDGIYWSYGAAESEGRIKEFVAKFNPSNWGPYQGFGDTGLATFMLRGNWCVGFDHGARRTSEISGTTGYRHILRGYLCEKAPIADPKERVRKVLAAMRLADGKNPFGEPVRTLSAPPPATPPPGP